MRVSISRMLGACGLLGAGVTLACSSTNDGPMAADASASVLVRLRMSGNGTDPDGIVAYVGTRSRTMHAGGSGTIDGLEPGKRTVSLTNLATHCWTQNVTQEVVLESGRQAEVEFPVECYGGFVYSMRAPGVPITDRVRRVTEDGGTVELWAADAGPLVEGLSTDGTHQLVRTQATTGTPVPGFILLRADGISQFLVPSVAGGILITRGSLSPDGTRVVFDRSQRPLLIVDNAGSMTEVPGTSDADFPTWSPDGARIGFKTFQSGPGHAMMTMRTDGSDIRLIGRVDDPPIPSLAELKWSPDGTALGYIAFRSDGGRLGIMSVADGSKREVAPPDGSLIADFEWSRDSRQVIVRIVPIDNFLGPSSILIVNADGTEPILAMRNIAGVRRVSLSGDGKKILLVGEFRAFIANIDGTGFHPFLDGLTVYSVMWEPGSKPGR